MDVDQKFYIFVCLLFMSHLVFPSGGDRHPNVKCLSNSECDTGECCVLGMDRYSYPACRPQVSEGEMCRYASQKKQNITVGYPDGMVIHLTNIHMVMCDCSNGLHCELQSGLCVKSN